MFYFTEIYYSNNGNLYEENSRLIILINHTKINFFSDLKGRHNLGIEDIQCFLKND